MRGHPQGTESDHGLTVLRSKAIKPLLAAAQELRPAHNPEDPCPIHVHYETIRVAMQNLFHELGIYSRRIRYGVSLGNSPCINVVQFLDLSLRAGIVRWLPSIVIRAIVAKPL